MARLTRGCMAGCAPDQAPKHTVAIPPDPSTGVDLLYWHFDCHILATGCEACKESLAAVGTDESAKGLKNEKLVAALEKKIESLNGGE